MFVFFLLCVSSLFVFFFYKFNGKALSCLKLPFTLCFLRPVNHQLKAKMKLRSYWKASVPPLRTIGGTEVAEVGFCEVLLCL